MEYVDTPDGETVIFKNKGINYLTTGKELQIKRTFHPRKGDMIMFNQDYLHAGCPPFENDYRLVINYNILIKNKMPEMPSNENTSCCKSEDL